MRPPRADSIAHSFDRSFDSYHDAAQMQAEIAHWLAVELAQAGAPKHFASGFEIGCGTGHLTQELAQRFEFDSLCLNDLLLRSQATASTFGAEFLHGDARLLPWPKAPDLIASASTIQWFENPEGFLEQALEALAPQGWLAVSGFGPNQFHELSALGFAQHAPGLRDGATLKETLKLAMKAQSSALIAKDSQKTMWFDTPLDLLKHLRRTGVNAGKTKTWTRGALRDFSELYQQKFGSERGVPLTYHASLLVAQKP